MSRVGGEGSHEQSRRVSGVMSRGVRGVMSRGGERSHEQGRG